MLQPKKSNGEGAARSGSLGQQAYQVLRRALRDGLIQAGRHYSEAELAEDLGISRTPVREALKALEREGVLEAAPHRGYRLRTFSPEEIDEIVIVRRALERIAVTAFIERATEADMAELADVLSRQNDDEKGQNIFALDEEFHLTIAERAGLTRTRDMLMGLRSATAAISAGLSIPLDETRQRVDEHHAIYAAIEERDVETATRLMDEHVEHAILALREAPDTRLVIKPLRD